MAAGCSYDSTEVVLDDGTIGPGGLAPLLVPRSRRTGVGVGHDSHGGRDRAPGERHAQF
jgi:hypothetical protein